MIQHGFKTIRVDIQINRNAGNPNKPPFWRPDRKAENRLADTLMKANRHVLRCDSFGNVFALFTVDNETELAAALDVISGCAEITPSGQTHRLKLEVTC